MYCSKCGAFNNRENKFCINCGSKLLKEDLFPSSEKKEFKTNIKSQKQSEPSSQEIAPEKTSSLEQYLQKEKKGMPFFDIGSYINDKYQLKKFVGRGGMGEVYKAYDTQTNRYVAIKMMLPSLMENEDIVRRFLNEAKIVKQIIHPNIVRAIESGDFDGIGYIVMDFVEGISLRKWIDDKSKNADTEEILNFLIQLCDGLRFAHGYTIHRDIKPENIIITDEGIIKIMDFGIAKTLSISQLTETHSSMGTAYYMSPEQTKGASVVDERSDLFSVGVIFYEMLTGKIPIGNFKIPTSTKRLITGKIGQILKKALEPDPEDRFKNAEEMHDALKEARDEIKKIKIERKVFEGQKGRQKEPEFFIKKGKQKVVLKWIIIYSALLALVVLGAGSFYFVSAVKTKKIKYFDKPEFDIKTVSFKTTEDLIPVMQGMDSVTNLPVAVETKASGIEMMLIPGGAFIMGLPEGKGEDDESPQHKVLVDSFYIGKYEITNRQYKMFVDEMGYYPPVNVFGEDSEYSLWDGQFVPDEILDYPVINISWDDAMAFCMWLCKKEGVPEGVYRLPTEAEWEKAAKGPEGYIYPWGNSSPTRKNLNYDNKWEGPMTLKKVGSYPANSYGIHDMAGNVVEWCMDKYKENFYSFSEYENPICETGEQRVLRGGSWSSYSYLVRTTNRYSNEPEVKYFYNGFRVVRTMR
ncbi:SUMF1/EgtB/PvdO family nonheme iron enzyme [bacterium]|nr:SUMF1/EgtB/PvdO family nonheme iron enzyme [bacterium]